MAALRGNALWKADHCTVGVLKFIVQPFNPINDQICQCRIGIHHVDKLHGLHGIAAGRVDRGEAAVDVVCGRHCGGKRNISHVDTGDALLL